jgi:multidrug efflux pump subunit AcrA (membrane-fusion protein)
MAALSRNRDGGSRALARCGLPLLALALAGCGGGPVADAIAFTVEPADFVVRVRVEGQLVASESQAVTLPPTVQQPMTLAWIVPDGTLVEAGEVIARFDGDSYLREQERAAVEMSRIDLRRDSKALELESEMQRIATGVREVELERGLAERFPVLDERLYSRNEIIDALADLGFLEAQEAFYRWREGNHAERTAAELGLLAAQRQGHAQRHALQSAALEQLEVRAPSAGMVMRERNFWGEMTEPGQVVFPGLAVARIPTPGAIEARLWVPESDAAGLAVDQRVELRLDAFPQRLLQGRVTSVDTVASTRDRQSPVKFFGLTVRFDAVDEQIMRVGNRVFGEVIVAERPATLTVPVQALLEDGEGRWVQVLNGRRLERRPVRVGVRSTTRVEITDGLAPGERVALTRPGAENGA